MKRRGFTLIEILAVIIILGILAIVAIPVVSNYIVDSRSKTFLAHEKDMEEAARSLTIECIDGKENCILPTENNTNDIYLSELIEKGFTERLQNPQGGGYCNEELSYVRVTNTGKSDYEYQACLYCGSYVTESDKCVDISTSESGTPPVCGTVTGESSEWTNKPRTITVACTDPDNDCRYNTYPKTYKTTTNSDQIIIGDMKNHITRCPVAVRVDTTPPTCELEIIKDDEVTLNGTNWLSGNVYVRLKNNTDAHSGLNSYGMGMSKEADYNKKTEINLTGVSGLVTVFGYVKDNAGNEGTCKTNLRVGLKEPDFDIYYGYHIFPQKEDYDTNDISVSNGSITVNGSNPTLTFDDMSKYTNAKRVALVTTSSIYNATNYQLSVDNGTNYITGQKKENKRIEFELPGGTYSKYIFKIPNNITISRLEVQQKNNRIIACKNVSVNLHPDLEREKIKTTGFSFDNGATFQSNYYKMFDVKDRAISGVAQTTFDTGLKSVKRNYSIVKGDCNAPTISITFTPDTWTNGNVTLTGNGQDTSSGLVGYAFSKGSSVPYDSNNWKTDNLTLRTTAEIVRTETATTNGNYYFNLKDEAGNIVSARAVIDKIDKIRPVCEILDNSKLHCTDTGDSDYAASSINGYIFGKNATDNGTYTEVTPTNNMTVTGTVNDTGTWNLYAKDRAGNKSLVASDTYYRVTYDMNGGSSCTKSSEILRSGRAIDLTPTCSRTGYTFKGWKNADGAAVTSMSISENTTLYARWEVNVYSISYNYVGGTAPNSGVPASYTYGVGATVNGRPTKSNYTFNGWDSGSSKAFSHTISTTATGDKSFTAMWCKNCSSVSYGSCSLNADTPGTCTYTTSCNNSCFTLTGSGTSSPTCTDNSRPVAYPFASTYQNGTIAYSTAYRGLGAKAEMTLVNIGTDCGTGLKEVKYYTSCDSTVKTATITGDGASSKATLVFNSCSTPTVNLTLYYKLVDNAGLESDTITVNKAPLYALYGMAYNKILYKGSSASNNSGNIGGHVAGTDADTAISRIYNVFVNTALSNNTFSDEEYTSRLYWGLLGREKEYSYPSGGYYTWMILMTPEGSTYNGEPGHGLTQFGILRRFCSNPEPQNLYKSWGLNSDCTVIPQDK